MSSGNSLKNHPKVRPSKSAILNVTLVWIAILIEANSPYSIVTRLLCKKKGSRSSPVSLIRLIIRTARLLSACGLIRGRGERTHRGSGWIGREMKRPIPRYSRAPGLLGQAREFADGEVVPPPVDSIDFPHLEADLVAPVGAEG